MRTKISLRAIADLPPNSIIWDTEIPGLNVRRQFSAVVTYSIVYRTLEGTQRWQRIGRHGVCARLQLIGPSPSLRAYQKLLKNAAQDWEDWKPVIHGWQALKLKAIRRRRTDDEGERVDEIVGIDPSVKSDQLRAFDRKRGLMVEAAGSGVECVLQ
jgi:hypothetical protein